MSSRPLSMASSRPQGPPPGPSGAMHAQGPPRPALGPQRSPQVPPRPQAGPPRQQVGPPRPQTQGPPRLGQLQGSPRPLQSQGAPRPIQTQGPPRSFQTQGPPRPQQTQGPPRPGQLQAPARPQQSQGPPRLGPGAQGPPRPSFAPPKPPQGPSREALSEAQAQGYGLTKPRTNTQHSMPKQEALKTEGEVRQEEVECVAPYEEADWLPLARDAARPSSVQYASLLSPPHHKTSLLRLEPAAQKGLAATETNTLLFMVMEGEVTVVLNTTQFLVGRGDSFFVPPNNSYNLLNLSGTRAELFLVQYRHQGQSRHQA